MGTITTIIAVLALMLALLAAWRSGLFASFRPVYGGSELTYGRPWSYA